MLCSKNDSDRKEHRSGHDCTKNRGKFSPAPDMERNLILVVQVNSKLRVKELKEANHGDSECSHDREGNDGILRYVKIDVYVEKRSEKFLEVQPLVYGYDYVIKVQEYVQILSL